MHYTLASGIHTEQVSSRCPVCLTVTIHAGQVDLTDRSVCCSGECYEQYRKALFALLNRARKWWVQQQSKPDYISVSASRLVEEYLRQGDYS